MLLRVSKEVKADGEGSRGSTVVQLCLDFLSLFQTWPSLLILVLPAALWPEEVGQEGEANQAQEVMEVLVLWTAA